MSYETTEFSASLHLSEREKSALRQVGIEQGSYTDWAGHETASLTGLRQHGLVISLLGYWRLTTIGRQVYEQMFEREPA